MQGEWRKKGIHGIIRLPSRASVDHDHEAGLHDIIRLLSES